MATLQAADKVLVTFVGSLVGETIMSTFGYVASTVTGTPQQAAVFDALFADIQGMNKLKDRYLACVPQNYNLSLIWFQVISPSRFGKVPRAVTIGAGTQMDAATTANVAAVITRRGDLGNRSNVSTLHVPIAPTAANVVGGQLTQNMLDRLDMLSQQITAPIVLAAPAVTFTPSIFNGTTPITTTPITAAFGQGTARVMRRRTKGLGI